MREDCATMGETTTAKPRGWAGARKARPRPHAGHQGRRRGGARGGEGEGRAAPAPAPHRIIIKNLNIRLGRGGRAQRASEASAGGAGAEAATVSSAEAVAPSARAKRAQGARAQRPQQFPRPRRSRPARERCERRGRGRRGRNGGQRRYCAGEPRAPRPPAWWRPRGAGRGAGMAGGGATIICLSVMLFSPANGGDI
jgi:hypothetical protein